MASFEIERQKVSAWLNQSKKCSCCVVGFSVSLLGRAGIELALQQLHHLLLAGVGLGQGGGGRLLNDLGAGHFARGRGVIGVLDLAG